MPSVLLTLAAVISTSSPTDSLVHVFTRSSLARHYLAPRCSLAATQRAPPHVVWSVQAVTRLPMLIVSATTDPKNRLDTTFAERYVSSRPTREHPERDGPEHERHADVDRESDRTDADDDRERPSVRDRFEGCSS